MFRKFIVAAVMACLALTATPAMAADFGQPPACDTLSGQCSTSTPACELFTPCEPADMTACVVWQRVNFYNEYVRVNDALTVLTDRFNEQGKSLAVAQGDVARYRAEARLATVRRDTEHTKVVRLRHKVYALRAQLKALRSNG